MFSLNFAILKANFHKNLSEVRQNFMKMVKSVERVMRLCKKLTKFPENYSKISGIPEKNRIFRLKNCTSVLAPYGTVFFLLPTLSLPPPQEIKTCVTIFEMRKAAASVAK